MGATKGHVEAQTQSAWYQRRLFDVFGRRIDSFVASRGEFGISSPQRENPPGPQFEYNLPKGASTLG